MKTQKKKIVFATEYFDEDNNPYYVDEMAKAIGCEVTDKGMLKLSFPIIQTFDKDTIYVKREYIIEEGWPIIKQHKIK